MGDGMEIPNIKGCSGAPAVVAGITTTDARCSIFQPLLSFAQDESSIVIYQRFISNINKSFEEGYEVVVMVEVEARNMIVGDSTLDPSTAQHKALHPTTPMNACTGGCQNLWRKAKF
jgi:hypothetical protein